MRVSYRKGEEQLVKACVAGKRKAQKELYELYCDQMMAVCLRYARSYMEAEDVMQEGFLRVFKKLDTYKGNGSLEGWIRRVIINVAIKNYHRNSRLYVMASMEDIHEEPSQDVVSEYFDHSDLMDMVQSLPDGYRMVFNLYAIEGYSHKEIAAMLDISEGTSKSQLARARKTLQRMLRPKQEYRHSKVGNEQPAG